MSTAPWKNSTLLIVTLAGVVTRAAKGMADDGANVVLLAGAVIATGNGADT